MHFVVALKCSSCSTAKQCKWIDPDPKTHIALHPHCSGTLGLVAAHTSLVAATTCEQYSFCLQTNTGCPDFKWLKDRGHNWYSHCSPLWGSKLFQVHVSHKLHFAIIPAQITKRWNVIKVLFFFKGFINGSLLDDWADTQLFHFGIIFSIIIIVFHISSLQALV